MKKGYRNGYLYYLDRAKGESPVTRCFENFSEDTDTHGLLLCSAVVL